MTLAPIHRFLDRSSWKTYAYERLVSLLFEAVLLLVCALPLVRSWRSALAQIAILILQLHASEVRRELASIDGRHAEAGGVSPLPEAKAALRAKLERHLDLVSWVWPGLAAAVTAVESRSVALGAVLGLLATLARVAWGRALFPAWRRSRLAWRAEQLGPMSRRAARLAASED